MANTISLDNLRAAAGVFLDTLEPAVDDVVAVELVDGGSDGPGAVVWLCGDVVGVNKEVTGDARAGAFRSWDKPEPFSRWPSLCMGGLWR